MSLKYWDYLGEYMAKKYQELFKCFLITVGTSSHEKDFYKSRMNIFYNPEYQNMDF